MSSCYPCLLLSKVVELWVIVLCRKSSMKGFEFLVLSAFLYVSDRIVGLQSVQFGILFFNSLNYSDQTSWISDILRELSESYGHLQNSAMQRLLEEPNLLEHHFSYWVTNNAEKTFNECLSVTILMPAGVSSM